MNLNSVASDAQGQHGTEQIDGGPYNSSGPEMGPFTLGKAGSLEKRQ